MPPQETLGPAQVAEAHHVMSGIGWNAMAGSRPLPWPSTTTPMALLTGCFGVRGVSHPASTCMVQRRIVARCHIDLRTGEGNACGLVSQYAAHVIDHACAAARTPLHQFQIAVIFLFAPSQPCAGYRAAECVFFLLIALISMIALPNTYVT